MTGVQTCALPISLIGPFSLFHLLSLFVMVYAAVMLATAPNVSVKHERAAA